MLDVQLWFARQNRFTECWPLIKPNYSTKILKPICIGLRGDLSNYLKDHG